MTKQVGKERPRCRQVILKHRLRPNERDGKWDGFSARTPEGEWVHLSEGLAKQMRRMMAEKHWSEWFD